MLKSVMYLEVWRTHVKLRGRRKNFHAAKQAFCLATFIFKTEANTYQSEELFGAEEFNLAIAILNSEAPNNSEDW